MRRSLLVVLLLGILVVTIVPTYAFVIPPNPSGEDNNYELYGPHVKGLNIKVYSNTTAEWNAMAAGQLDLEDWALNSTLVTLWSNNTNGMVEANYDREAGYYLLDIENNATYAASDAGPFVHNPTSELPLRQALAYAVNRSDIVQFTGGLALPMYTPVPNYMAGYVNTNIDPTGSLAALSYDNPDRGGDTSAAIALLNANGYTIDLGGWRIDPATGLELKLIFYSRQGDRGTFGDHYNAVLNNVLKINTDYHAHVPRSTVTGPIFAQGYFNLYTGGWTGIGPDPDYLCDLYNGSNYYHPGSPPNYDGINYADLNGNLTTIKLAPSLTVGMAATMDAQVYFAEHVAAVPLWSYTGVKDYKNNAVANGGQWADLVNQKGIGVNSWYSTLNMKQVNNMYPNVNAYYGFSSTVTLQNMVYVQWFWDQEVVGRIYDGGARRDPYTLASWVPQLYKSWTVGSWHDVAYPPGVNKTALTITLRPDVYWSDGQPFTAADVYYTLVEISKDLLAKGFPPPWWYPTVQYMRSVSILDDYNIQILLDVQSVWAVGWVIGSVVMPKHIWKPIVDASTVGSSSLRNVDATTPDPYIIGTGPFRWYSGVGSATGQTIVLVANSPGSSAPDPATGLTPLISPGYYFYNPIYVDVNPTNGLSKINILPTANSTTIPLNVTLRNLWTGGNLTVNEYVYVYDTAGNPYLGSGVGGLMPGYPLGQNLLPVSPYPSGVSDVKTFTLTLPKSSLWFVKVAAQIAGPPTILGTQLNPWISSWVNATQPIWVTTTKDIAGTTLYDVSGYTGPAYPAWLKNEVPASDLRVDMRDVACAALAFGSVPGGPNWSPVADVNHDYKVDGTDIVLIALSFGYGSGPTWHPSQSSEPYSPDSMWVDIPASAYSNVSVGSTFNATVWLNITSATSVFAYQTCLHYNSTLLQCTQVGFTAPPTSDFFAGHNTVACRAINSSCAPGRILAGETLMGSYDVITGPHNGSLIWATFQVIALPSPGQTVSAGFDISSDYPMYTWVLDGNGSYVPIMTRDGQWIVSSPQPHNADSMWVEQSDTKLATGDTVYVGSHFGVFVYLNVTENVTSYQVALHYNRTQLRCVNAAFSAGSTSNFMAGHSTAFSGLVIDTSFLGNGSVLAFESCAGPDYVQGPHCGSLFWMDFEVLATPTSGSLTSTFNISTEYPAYTYAFAENLTSISFTPYDGSYEITPGTHDIAVTSLYAYKKIVFQGYSINVSTTVQNQGGFTENFNVTLLANLTSICRWNITLGPGDVLVIPALWNTNGFAKGNYTLSAYAEPVPGDSNVTNNNFTGPPVMVFVTFTGDLTGGTSHPWDFVPDGKVEGQDIAIVALCFGSAPGCPPPYTWNANCDVNNDGKVDGADIAIVALHFGQAG